MSNILRLIVAGSRTFNNYDVVSNVLDQLLADYADKTIEIVSGTCVGVDKLGERYAREHGYSVKRFPAKWSRYGRAAGPIRNREMAEYAAEEEGFLIAFWDGMSPGTGSMVHEAERAGIRIGIIGTGTYESLEEDYWNDQIRAYRISK